jgi:hypothetical protein
LLLELRKHALDPAVLLNQGIDDRDHLRADGTTQQTIQQAHIPSARQVV